MNETHCSGYISVTICPDVMKLCMLVRLGKESDINEDEVTLKLTLDFDPIDVYERCPGYF